MDASIPGPLPLSPARRRVATGAVLLGLVVAAFEGTVVTSAMPTIAKDLGGLSLYAWVFSAFLVASTVSVVLCGKLADSFGRRPVFVFGMLLFLAGSALCGSASSITQLVAFRVVQGLGAGAIQPVAMTISADLYTLEERARIQALFTSAWGVANVLGPILGGFLVMHLSWRWVFYVNVPVGVPAVLLLVAAYRDPPRAPRAARAASLVRRPLALLSGVEVRAGLVASAFVGALLYACAAYVPLWVTGRAGDAMQSGLALAPMLVGWSIGSSFGVKVLVRRGMRTSVAGGFAIAAMGAAAFAVVVALRLPTAAGWIALAVLGLGLGPAGSTSMVAAQAAVAWQERGFVTSALYALRMLGRSLAVTLLGAGSLPSARFAEVALIAFAALASLATLAPRGAARRAESAPRVPQMALDPAE